VTRDAIVVGLLVLAFATLVTAHVTLALGLMRRAPRWHGLVALVVPPLAPWWAWRDSMRVRGAIWVAAAIAYAAALAAAAR
jgi:hypothetical protein